MKRKISDTEEASENTIPENTRHRSQTQKRSTAINSYFNVRTNKSKMACSLEVPNTKPGSRIQWRSIGTTWIGNFKMPSPSSKFAAFDLDNTLIEVKGTHKFPRNSDDWRLLHPEIPSFLNKLHTLGYKILIISNQAGLKPKKGSTELSKKAQDFRSKIEKIAECLDIPFSILVATGKDYMRKPSPGMWLIAELDNGEVKVDRTQSWYVGDAAGRPHGWKRGAKADFSDSDLAFSLNAGVPFYTPEEVFIDSIINRTKSPPLLPPKEWNIARFTPRYILNEETKAIHDSVIEILNKLSTEPQKAKKGILVLLVGPPASGKSTFATQHLEPRGFKRVNMDTLKTRKKCEKFAADYINEGTHVVVDNTNSDIAARRGFIDIAKKHNTRCVCIVFDPDSRDLAQHNNRFRATICQARYLTGSGIKDIAKLPAMAEAVPNVAFHSFYKKFIHPDCSEGLDEVLNYKFIPRFESPDDESIWSEYF